MAAKTILACFPYVLWLNLFIIKYIHIRYSYNIILVYLLKPENFLVTL